MMKQYINLYTDEFKPKKVIFSLTQLCLSSVALIVVLILASMGLTMSLEEDRRELSETQAKADSMAKRVAAMEAEVSLTILDDTLVQANKRLNDKISARRHMIRALNSLVIEDKDSPFSSVLVALARQPSPDLWLNHIHLGLSGRTMNLQGTTLDASAVPGYLQELRNESAFIGRSFSLFQLEADEKSKGRIHFELKSEVLLDGTEGSLSVSQQLGYPTIVTGGQP